jgi:hypothetical protein
MYSSGIFLGAADWIVYGAFSEQTVRHEFYDKEQINLSC